MWEQKIQLHSVSLSLYSRWKWAVRFPSWPVHLLEQSPRYTFGRKVGRPQSLPGAFAEKEYLLHLLGIFIVVHSVAQSCAAHAHSTPEVLFGRRYVTLVRPLAWIVITGGGGGFQKSSQVGRRSEEAKRMKILQHSFLNLGCIQKYVLSFTALLLYFRGNAWCIPDSVSKRWRKDTPPPSR
jgi:hypothetical protein